MIDISNVTDVTLSCGHPIGCLRSTGEDATTCGWCAEVAAAEALGAEKAIRTSCAAGAEADELRRGVERLRDVAVDRDTPYDEQTVHREDLQELLDEVDARDSQMWLEAGKPPGPHGFANADCPTFYDGCHCMVETLKDAFERADRADVELAEAKSEIAAGARLLAKQTDLARDAEAAATRRLTLLRKLEWRGQVGGGLRRRCPCCSAYECQEANGRGHYTGDGCELEQELRT